MFTIQTVAYYGDSCNNNVRACKHTKIIWNNVLECTRDWDWSVQEAVWDTLHTLQSLWWMQGSDFLSFQMTLTSTRQLNPDPGRHEETRHIDNLWKTYPMLHSINTLQSRWRRSQNYYVMLCKQYTHNSWKKCY